MACDALACALYLYGVGTMLPIITVIDIRQNSSGTHLAQQYDIGLPDRPHLHLQPN